MASELRIGIVVPMGDSPFDQSPIITKIKPLIDKLQSELTAAIKPVKAAVSVDVVRLKEKKVALPNAPTHEAAAAPEPSKVEPEADPAQAALPVKPPAPPVAVVGKLPPWQRPADQAQGEAA